jgi:hypothetical protein
MSVYQPPYTDPKTGEKKKQNIYVCDFWFHGTPIKESTGTTRKTLAKYEQRKRPDIEKAFAGVPTQAPAERVASVGDRIKTYLENYKLNHRAKSVIFSTQRLAHVKRLLGKCVLFELTEDRIHDYIRTRLEEGAGGRTINMEVGELSRALKLKWSFAWPNVRKHEENHDVGKAMPEEEEQHFLDTAAADTSPNRNPLLYPYLQTGLLTGMRDGEMKSLRWTR